jgi:hypothetical protein
MRTRTHKPLPSVEDLRKLFCYDPDSGQLTWRDSRRGGVKPGDQAGALTSGYYKVTINRAPYYVHRIIWKMVTGDDPAQLQIDHADHDRLNNRWSNLRLADNRQNNCNRPPQRNNTTGYKGVTFHKPTQKFRAYIKHLGRQIHIGLFPTAEEAYAAYSSKAAELHCEFARL